MDHDGLLQGGNVQSSEQAGIAGKTIHSYS